MKGELLAALGDGAPRPTWRRPPPRSRSVSSASAAATPTASSACTSSTRCRRWSWSSSACPTGIRPGIAERAHAWCERIGKRAIEVPDQPGFVVNRLLFPFLFDAVRLMERADMTPAEVDDCMTLGAGHPMGPLRLLDFVGIDVAVAIGHQLRAEGGDESHSPPPSLERLVAEGRLGRKCGGGFYEYE